MTLATSSASLVAMAEVNASALKDGPLTEAWSRSTGRVRSVFAREMRRRGLKSTPCSFCIGNPDTDCRFMYGED